MRAPMSRSILLALAAGVAWRAEAKSAHAMEGDLEDEGEAEGDGGAAADEGDRAPSSVYIIEHGFLDKATEWLPRGTLLLSGAASEKKQGGVEARLSDAKEFVQLRPELQNKMQKAAGKNSYYGIRMYSPENPQRVLQAAIPATLLAEQFEDWYDILDVKVGVAGIPVSLAYRVRHTLGLTLFDHTQVHLSQPSCTEGPRVTPRKVNIDGTPTKAAKEEEVGYQSMIRKYWWVILIVMFLVSSAGGDDGKGGGKGGGAKK